MNQMAALYVVSRVLYTVLYVFTSRRELSPLRTFAFLGQLGMYWSVALAAAVEVSSR